MLIHDGVGKDKRFWPAFDIKKGRACSVESYSTAHNKTAKCITAETKEVS